MRPAHCICRTTIDLLCQLKYYKKRFPSSTVWSVLQACRASWVISVERNPRWARWRSQRWTGMLSNQRRESLRSWRSTTEAERGNTLSFSMFDVVLLTAAMFPHCFRLNPFQVESGCSWWLLIMHHYRVWPDFVVSSFLKNLYSCD